MATILLNSDLPENYEAKSLKATLTIGTVEVPITEFTLRHGINEFPTAQVTVQLDNQNAVNSQGHQGSVDIDIDKVRVLMRVLQEAVQNRGRVIPNAVLHIVDPQGQHLRFIGFLGRPDTTISAGSFNLNFSLAHAKTVLQMWNGQVYDIPNNYVTGRSFSAAAFSKEDGAPVEFVDYRRRGSITMRLLALLKYMLRVHVPMGNTQHANEYDMLPMHLLNERALPYVEEVLRASRTSSDILTVKESLADSCAQEIDAHLMQLLTQLPSLWFVLQQLARSFLMQINADWMGHLWVERQYMCEEPATWIDRRTKRPEVRRISVPQASIRFNSSNLNEPPLLQVIVTGNDSGQYVRSNQDNIAQPTPDPTAMPAGQAYVDKQLSLSDLTGRMWALVKYPASVDKTVAGTFLVRQAPSWLGSWAFTHEDLKVITDAHSTGSRFRASIVVQQALDDRAKIDTEGRERILKYIAEQTFKQEYLSGTSAMMQVPFDVRPQVGRTYLVTDLQGKPLFKGYLHSVMHSGVVATDGSAQASTTLAFSHIIVSGATLTGFTVPSKPATTLINNQRIT